MPKQTQATKRIIGLPKDTERLTHSLLTSADDPAYAMHMMTSSLMRVPPRSERKGESSLETSCDDQRRNQPQPTNTDSEVTIMATTEGRQKAILRMERLIKRLH
jgi:hypothetical protein